MTRILRGDRDDRGIILPMTLMVLVILATLVSAMLALGTTEPQIAANLVRGAQSLSLAEAGADRAMALFAYDPTYIPCVQSANNFDDYPSYPSGIPQPPCGSGSGATLWTNATTGVSGGSTGCYSVLWAPTPSAAYATILITATGAVPTGTASCSTTDSTTNIIRVVRLIVTRQWASNYGVLANSVKITGNAQVSGNSGAVHGNGTVDLTGSEYVQQTATTAGTGSCTGCDSADRVGDTADSGSGKPTVTLPNKVAGDYKSRANIFLGSSSNPSIPLAKCTGTINVVSGSPLRVVGTTTTTSVPAKYVLDSRTTSCTLYATPASGVQTPDYTALTGWTANAIPPDTTSPFGNAGYSSSPSEHWTLGDAVDGVYYTPNEIDVNGGGSSGTPWYASFIAGDATTNAGMVSMSGNPYIRPYFSQASIPTSQRSDFFIIAGNVDLTGTGNFGGEIIATSSADMGTNSGNINIHGNIQLTGNLIAYNKAYVTGSAAGGGLGKIIYNVNTRSHVLSPDLKIVSWHAISTLN